MLHAGTENIISTGHRRVGAIAIAVMLALPMSIVNAKTPSNEEPNFTLAIPGDFNHTVTVTHFKKGDDVLNSPPCALVTIAAMTEYAGCWGSCLQQSITNHWWRVRVYKTRGQKTASAYAHARDGYEADLSEARDYLNYNEGPYGFARFKRKRFRWGRAVSMLTLSAQDGIYTPNNGHLYYEIWGITAQKKYAVIVSFLVTHPNLPTWGDAGIRDAESITALKNDRDYTVIEMCSPNQFQPSLTAVDRLVDSLNVE